MGTRAILEEQEISILMLTETHLGPEKGVHFRGYQIFRRGRGAKGGGVAVLVKNDMQAKRLELASELEVVGVEVEIGGRRCRFLSLYIPATTLVSEEALRGLL